jgi:HNH endonuclease
VDPTSPSNAQTVKRSERRSFLCQFCHKDFSTRDRWDRPSPKFCSRACTDAFYARPQQTCTRCGKVFKPKMVDRTTYCSRECAYADQKEKHLAKGRKPAKVRTCAACGAQYVDAPLKFPGCTTSCCSSACRAKQRQWKCSYCGKDFNGSQRSKWCSQQCRYEANKGKWNENKREKHRERNSITLQELKCVACGEHFFAYAGPKRQRAYCTLRCGTRWAKKSSGTHIQRARRFGVSYEPIKKIAVFIRDHWRCQICGIETPQQYMGSIQPNAPELDHRIPMSKGGGHVWGNVQCTCRSCNGKKGASLIVSDLP